MCEFPVPCSAHRRRRETSGGPRSAARRGRHRCSAAAAAVRSKATGNCHRRSPVTGPPIQLATFLQSVTAVSSPQHTERSLLTSGTDAGNAIIGPKGDKLMPGTATIGPDFDEMSVSSMRDDEPSLELNCEGENVR